MSRNAGRPRPGDQGAPESNAAGTGCTASVDAPAVEVLQLPHGLFARIELRPVVQVDVEAAAEAAAAGVFAAAPAAGYGVEDATSAATAAREAYLERAS